MKKRNYAQTFALGLGFTLLVHPLSGLAQAETLSQQELYNLCSRFPHNSSCEGYEAPIALSERQGSRVSCSLALNNPAGTDRCKLLVEDEQLTLYFEYGDRLSFLPDNSRASEAIEIPFDNILAFNLRIWHHRLDAFSFFLGGNYYVLGDTEYENLESNFDPANNSNERGAVGEQNFAEIEIDFLGAPETDLGNQSNILQIATTENFGNFLGLHLAPVTANASIDSQTEQLRTGFTGDEAAEIGGAEIVEVETVESLGEEGVVAAVAVGETAIATLPDEQLQQFLDTRVCVRCDLQGVDLAQADLRDANLEGSNLANANLAEVNLENAYLVGVDLSHAILTNANLSGASLTLASLTAVDAEEVNLEGASLQNADLQGAALTNARFSGADLEGANLEDAVLEDADFSDSTRTRSFIPFLGIQRFNYYTSARRSNLQGANLSNANLDHASLSHANLTSANLTEASLNETNLNGADLTSAVFSEEIPDNVKLCGATLPDGTFSEKGCPDLEE